LIKMAKFFSPMVKEELVRDNERDIRNARSPEKRSQFFNSGKAVGGLINPARAARDEMARLGVDLTVDHAKRNRETLQKISHDRMKAEIAKEEAKALEPFKMERFKQAETRVYEPHSIKAALAPEPRKDFLSKGAGIGAGRLMKDPIPDPLEWTKAGEVFAPKPRPPAANELAPIAQLEDVDFIAKNTMAMVRSQPRSKDSQKKPDAKHANFAKIPEYLEARKAELDEIKRQKEDAMRTKDQPAGMVLMSDAERLRTLDVLKSNYEGLHQELGHFAIVCDTVSRKRRKDDIEAKLKEIEAAIALFSKEKVWVTN
jgi:hypothetical protein